jgi:predicted ATPase
VGNFGKIIIDIFPDMELIIGNRQNILFSFLLFINLLFLQGPQPNIPIANYEETLFRFNETFCAFIASLACRERPLVIFLDDVHCMLLDGIRYSNTKYYLL